MKKHISFIAHSLLCLLFFLAQLNNSMAQPISDTTGLHTLIVFFDGLRPDYITPENMPNLYAFRQRGCYGNQHHSVFPTVTRVNASSYATGSYPATHGILGNTVYFPEVDKKKGLNTGEASELNKISNATHGHLLTAISLGEILQQAGARMMVFSSGSSGQALLQNHTVGNGAVINTSMILPDSLRPLLEKELGPIPPAGDPNTSRHQWVTNALLRYGLTPAGPLVSAIWFSDPDGTAHRDGIGAPAAMESIRSVDKQFGRIIADLENKQLTNHFNIIVSADHGFVSYVGKQDLTDFLIKEGLKKDQLSEDVIVSENAVYVNGHDPQVIQHIISRLQSQEWVGGIYTKAVRRGNSQGCIPGTISFDAIHWNHPQRAADILVDYNWDDRKNAAGYVGASFSRGVAGHGSCSPYEVHIALLAAGPSFRQSFTSESPTSNVDIVPTILHIHHIPIPPAMDGRIMSEFLPEENAQPLPVAKKESFTSSAKYDGGIYTLTLTTTVLGKYKYVDYSQVIRSEAAKTP